MYYEVKEMNLSEIQKIKESIVKCDKIIHMQQLGVVWEPPKNSKEGEMEGMSFFDKSLNSTLLNLIRRTLQQGRGAKSRLYREH
jgi:hypothetical protein